MAEKIHVEVISREVVKPSRNNHPKTHILSFFDQLMPCFYVPSLFFYTSKNGTITDHNHHHNHNHRSSVLKASLSVALSHYYPLAGRMEDSVSVDCNDEGALFLEAAMECALSQVLKNPHSELVKLLLPHSISLNDLLKTGPLVVQVTYFQCVGMSIGIYLSHKIMDMASISCFIKDWASLARNSEEKISPPEFNIGSLYPPLDLPFLNQNMEAPPERKDCVSRRFVFYGSKIAELKQIVEDQVPNPTRVEVVSSLLYKSVLSATNSSGCIMSGFVNHAMNLRNWLNSPPISERNKGNVVAMFQVSVREDTEVGLGFLVKEFRNEKSWLSDSCANITNTEDLCSLILKNMETLFANVNVKGEMYGCSSWCRYPFYDTDFGWGKPFWVATDFLNLNNAIALIDTKEGDGIEAFISLEAKAMAAFEKDQELLSFSRVDPSVLD